MTETVYPQRSAAALAICHPRWIGWIDGKRNQPDPCSGCPLYQPCVQQGAGEAARR